MSLFKRFTSLFPRAQSHETVSVALCTPFRLLRFGRAGSRTERASSGWLSALQVCRGMNKLFVGNLDDSTSSTDLERLFGEHGQLVSAVVISDRFTGNSRGFGFVRILVGG